MYLRFTLCTDAACAEVGGATVLAGPRPLLKQTQKPRGGPLQTRTFHSTHSGQLFPHVTAARPQREQAPLFSETKGFNLGS